MIFFLKFTLFLFLQRSQSSLSPRSRYDDRSSTILRFRENLLNPNIHILHLDEEKISRTLLKDDIPLQTRRFLMKAVCFGEKTSLTKLPIYNLHYIDISNFLMTLLRHHMTVFHAITVKMLNADLDDPYILELMKALGINIAVKYEVQNFIRHMRCLHTEFIESFEGIENIKEYLTSILKVFGQSDVQISKILDEMQDIIFFFNMIRNFELKKITGLELDDIGYSFELTDLNFLDHFIKSHYKKIRRADSDSGGQSKDCVII